MFGGKKITEKEIIRKAISAGLLEVIFIILVACFFLCSESLFPAHAKSLILGIMSVLILLVLGAALSAVLIFALPLYFFLQKKYKEALIALGAALGILAAVLILIILLEIFVC